MYTLRSNLTAVPKINTTVSIISFDIYRHTRNRNIGFITKARLYNFDPLKPHFYIVKQGFRGVYIIFLFSAQKHRLWYSLEPPR